MNEKDPLGLFAQNENDPLGLFSDDDPLGLFKTSPTTWTEDLGIGLNEAAKTLVKGAGIIGGGAASIFDTDTADKIYGGMEDQLKSMDEYWVPKGKEQDFTGKVIGTVGTLPMQVLAMPFSPADTGKSFIDNGENLGNAMAAAGVDTVGNLVGFGLPGAIGGKVLTKMATGAGINAAQDVATRMGISGIADTEKTKKQFEPTMESTALAGIVGAGMGPMSPNITSVKDLRDSYRQTETKPTSEPNTKIAETLLTDHGSRLLTDINTMQAELKTLREMGDATPAVLKLIEEQEAILAHKTQTLEQIQKDLQGIKEDPKVAEIVAKREQERQRKEGRPVGPNRRAGPDEEIPLSAYESETGMVRDNLPPVRQQPPEIPPHVDEADAALRSLEEQPPVTTETPKIEEQPVDPFIQQQQENIKARQALEEEALNRESIGLTPEELAERGITPKKYDEDTGTVPNDGIGINNPDVGYNIALKNIDSNEREIKKLQKQLDDYSSGLIPSGTLDVAAIQRKIDIHKYHLTKFENMRDFYEQRLNKPATKEQEIAIIEDKVLPKPEKLDTIDDVVDMLSKDPGDPDIPRQLDANQHLFDKQGSSNIFLQKPQNDTQKRMNKMLMKLIQLTNMANEKVYFMMSDRFARTGQAPLFGNTSVMVINPERIAQKYTNAIEKLNPVTKFFGEKVSNAFKDIVAMQVVAHELGHVLLSKYLRDNVTHVDELKQLQRDWDNYRKGGGQVSSGMLTELGTKKRTEYNQAFHEFFSDRISSYLIREHVLKAFDNRSKQYLGDLKRVIDFVKEQTDKIAKTINKNAPHDFSKDIINDIMGSTREYLADAAQRAQKAIDINETNAALFTYDAITRGNILSAKNQAAIENARASDKGAFPFHKKTLEDAYADLDSYDSLIRRDSGNAPKLEDVNPEHVSFMGLTRSGLHTLGRNLFGKLNYANILKDNPVIRKINDETRKAEKIANEIMNSQWYGDIQRGDWNAAPIWNKISKIKLESSAYWQTKNATPEDLGTVHDLFKKGFESQLDYTTNKTTNGQHLTPKQEKLYDTLSNLFKRQYEDVVKQQQRMGKKNILPERAGWYPSVRSGPYRVEVRYNGDIVYTQNFRSKPEADLFRKKIEKDNPGYLDIGEATKNHVDDVVSSDMIRTIEMVESIIKQHFGSAVSDPIKDKVEKALLNIHTKGGGLGQHHQYRTNLMGYKGSELYGSIKERGDSFREAIQSSVQDYSGSLRNMILKYNTDDYIHQLEQSGHDKVILNDAKVMLESAMNRTENMFQGMDDGMRNLWDSSFLNLQKGLKSLGLKKTVGLGRNSDFDTVRGQALELFYLTKLMSKIVFPINQILASTGAIREMSYSGGYIKPYMAYGKAIAKIFSNDADLRQAIFEVSQKTNTIEPQFLEALQLDKNNKLWESIKKYAFLSKVNEFSDSYSRMVTFAANYEMYKDLGMSRDKAIDAATLNTDRSMVAYGRSETAPIFNKMGLVGQAMKPLQTFGQAQLANFVADIRHLKKTDPQTWAPLLNYVLVSTLMAGATSLIFVQEYEMLRKVLSHHWPQYFGGMPSVFEVAKMDNTFFDNVQVSDEEKSQWPGVLAAYGVGALSGVDIMSSSRANETFPAVIAAILTGQENAFRVMPLFGALGTAAAGTVGMLMPGTTDAARRKAMTQALPSGHLGYAAKEAAGVNTTTVPSPDGTQSMDMVAGGADNDAIKRRELADIIAGTLGTKSTGERRIMDADALTKDRQKMIDERRKSLLSKFNDTGNRKYIQDLANTGLTNEEIDTMIKNKVYKKGAGIVERSVANAAGQPISTHDEAQRAKQFKEFGLYRAIGGK